MTSILFVCRANRYRSPIAAAIMKEAIVKQYQHWDVSSAGTWTTDGLPPISGAVFEAQELGLDIRGHQSRVITPQMVRNADLILVMEQDQKEALQVEFPMCRHKIALLTEVVEGESYDILDPMKYPGHVVGFHIKQLITTGLDRIAARASRGCE